jgi:large subunit ribosomal protein L5
MAKSEKKQGAKKQPDKKKKPEASAAPPPDYKPRLMQLYRERIRDELRQELGLKNIMQVPRLSKIVLNMGVGEGARDEKVLVAAEQDLALISGQKPQRNRAKLSVAAFKLRKGMPVGCSVTLRGWRMYEFLERLISVAIPRIRDFRGLSPRAFDTHGNYSFGIREHQIFTEVDTANRVHTFGMDITLVTTAPNKDQGRSLLAKFGMPFRES